jgi:hypothetical protein
MMMVTNYDFEQCKTLMVEVLQFLRSRNVSYSTANFVLEGAQKILQQAVRQEMKGIPLADGITYDINPDSLMTVSKRSIEDVA